MYCFERLNKFLNRLTKNMGHPVSSIIKNYRLNEQITNFFAFSLRNIDTYMSRWPKGSVAASHFGMICNALKSIYVDDEGILYHPFVSRVIAVVGELVEVTFSTLVVDSLLQYIVGNTQGAVHFAYVEYERRNPVQRRNVARPSFNEYLKNLPEVKPPVHAENGDLCISDKDYAILRNGMSGHFQVTRQCLLHGNVVSCLWNKKRNSPYLPSEILPYSIKSMGTTIRRSKAPQFLGVEFEDGVTHFGLPSCFFRLNFTSEVYDLPLTYVRWIGKEADAVGLYLMMVV